MARPGNLACTRKHPQLSSFWTGIPKERLITVSWPRAACKWVSLMTFHLCSSNLKNLFVSCRGPLFGGGFKWPHEPTYHFAPNALVVTSQGWESPQPGTLCYSGNPSFSTSNLFLKEMLKWYARVMIWACVCRILIRCLSDSKKIYDGHHSWLSEPPKVICVRLGKFSVASGYSGVSPAGSGWHSGLDNSVVGGDRVHRGVLRKVSSFHMLVAPSPHIVKTKPPQKYVPMYCRLFSTNGLCVCVCVKLPQFWMTDGNSTSCHSLCWIFSLPKNYWYPWNEIQSYDVSSSSLSSVMTNMLVVLLTSPTCPWAERCKCYF